MKYYRTLLIPFLLGWTLLAGLSGCREEVCEGVECMHGTCIGGNCACEAGFEGSACERESRVRFLGEWQVGDICRVNSYVYNSTISPGTLADQVLVSNLNEQGLTVVGVVNGLALNVPEQTFGNAILSGTGGIDTLAMVISLEYTIMAEAGPDDVCQAAFRLP